MNKVAGGQTSLTDANAGLIQSLLIKAQRATLDAIGQRLSTPVVYLKAAWADPVLYGGRGERTGCDIDILVRPDRFEAFAAELTGLGFRRIQFGASTYEAYFGHKEWTFEPPAGKLTVDLHRALTQPIWFDLDAAELMGRAIAWPSVDGPLLSLAPEDQILYAAVHYANHLYDLDDRHLEDCHRLLALREVDWDLIEARARRAQLRLPVTLLVEALRARGNAIPALRMEHGWGPLRVRRRLAGRWIGTTPRLSLRRPRSRALSYLLLRPLLSDRATALPRVAATFGVPWLRERLLRRRSLD
jgi:hypothetical protein